MSGARFLRIINAAYGRLFPVHQLGDTAGEYGASFFVVGGEALLDLNRIFGGLPTHLFGESGEPFDIDSCPGV